MIDWCSSKPGATFGLRRPSSWYEITHCPIILSRSRRPPRLHTLPLPGFPSAHELMPSDDLW